MDLSPAVKQRREKGKRWTNRIAVYLLVSTPIMLLFLPLMMDNGTIDDVFLLSPLLLANPYSVMAISLFVLPVPGLLTAAGILALVSLSFAGCQMLNKKNYRGKKLFVGAKAASIAISVILAVFMFFSMNWVSLSMTYVIIYPLISVCVPSLELFLVNMWIPEESIPKKAPPTKR